MKSKPKAQHEPRERSGRNWPIFRIKDVARINPATRIPKNQLVDFFPMDAIGVNGGLSHGLQKQSNEANGYSQFKSDDVLFAKVTPCFENEKSAIGRDLAVGVAMATTEVTVLRPRTNITPEFLHYRIKGLDFAVGGKNEMKGSAGLKRVPEKFAADFRFKLPEIDEQRRIATWLDLQTTRIDKRRELLAKKRELLDELRKSIIHESVTGKIDLSIAELPSRGPVVARAMMESGVNWIGGLPATWELKRFKNAGSFQTGKDHKALNVGGFPVFGSSSEPFAWVDRPLCFRKAIAIGRKGTIDRPFVIQPGFWAVDTCMFHTVLRTDFSLEYLGYWSHIVPWKEISTQTALPSLTQTDANNVIAAYPPVDEQQRIADFLDQRLSKIARQITLIDQLDDLLKQQRKALIHEAVTGKIDLSGYQPPAT